ncbi:hypothetical protein PIB30_023353 [Stylosanthes scabra]|uniref:RNase H type-1 domain-containing protein n=1 Tax=Stylosanthes scabra TaxID=79078 RepID=A0ABU6T997_9FABA|nr:hypothetical protein [Stylosanthes scabra]
MEKIEGDAGAVLGMAWTWIAGLEYICVVSPNEYNKLSGLDSKCWAYLVELWGVCIGLETIWTLGFKRVMLECDSSAVNSYLRNDLYKWDAGSILYHRIREMMSKD